MANRLLSINVGTPLDVDFPNGKRVATAIWKTPVTGRVIARRLNIDGDRQADLLGHGGEQRAVLVYQADSYRYWQKFLSREEMAWGQFGENLSVDGLPDSEVCIGDRFLIGDAIFEVSQPRVTCHKLAIHMNQDDMPSLMVRHDRPGFYLRVIREGEIGAGDEILKIAAAQNGMSVSAINKLLYASPHPRQMLRAASEIDALSPGWKESFRSLLDDNADSFANAGLSPHKLSPSAWTGFKQLKVSRISIESDDVKAIELADPSGSNLPAFRAGQHIVLRLPQRDGTKIYRSYSLTGSVSRGYRIAVKRLPSGLAGKYLHDDLAIGDFIDTSAPRGDFVLDAHTPKPVVFISGGIGVTPLLSMLYAIVEDRPTGDNVWWIHGSKNSSHTVFDSEVTALLAGATELRKWKVFSLPGQSDRLGSTYDHNGHITVEHLRELGVPKDSIFYICGPYNLQQDLIDGLSAWGVAISNVHIESFGDASVSSLTTTRKNTFSDGAPRVTFLKSNKSAAWNGQLNSLLELAEANDIAVKWSCRAGVCHRCETPLLGGTLKYDPDPIDPPPDGIALLCCAIPKDDVQLDL